LDCIIRPGISAGLWRLYWIRLAPAFNF